METAIMRGIDFIARKVRKASGVLAAKGILFRRAVGVNEIPGRFVGDNPPVLTGCAGTMGARTLLQSRVKTAAAELRPEVPQHWIASGSLGSFRLGCLLLDRLAFGSLLGGSVRDRHERQAEVAGKLVNVLHRETSLAANEPTKDDLSSTYVFPDAIQRLIASLQFGL